MNIKKYIYTPEWNAGKTAGYMITYQRLSYFILKNTPDYV